MGRVFAILPAAGIGRRFGGKKQFSLLNGESVLAWTLKPFVQSGLFAKIVVCLSKEDMGMARADSGDAVWFIEGGESRAESVHRGFNALDAGDGDIVLIHDAARPCVSVDLIRRVAEATQKNQAVIPALKVTDTIKEIDGDRIVKTVDREKLAAVQTPQGFSCALLKKVYKRPDAIQRFTDEAALCEDAGVNAVIVAGEKKNIKITDPEDLQLAEWILLRSE